MPAIDNCEPSIVRAMEKAGWSVTHQPFFLRVGKDESVFADVRFSSNREQIIVVEVKCFPEKRSVLDEFYHAVGQYILYRNVLKLKRLKEELYLAVPSNIYEVFFNRKTVQATIKDAKIKVLVVDIEKEEVVKWLV